MRIHRVLAVIVLATSLVLGVVYPSLAPNRAAESKSAFQLEVEAWAAAHRSVPPFGETGEGDEIQARADWRWNRWTYPTGRLPGGDWRAEALKQIQQGVPEAVPAGTVAVPGRATDGVIVPVTTTWTTMGPRPLDYSTQPSGYKYGIASGRMNAIAFEPGNPSVAYVGGSVGGVWKTTNCCSSGTVWTPLWDSPTLGANAIGAITVDPNNPNVVYVGTGDSQPPAGDMYGNGVYKSTDAGATWTQYGSGVFSPYGSAGVPAASCCAQAPDENIKAIVIDPHNSNTVIAGASYGVFISYDAGVTWTQYDVVNRNVAPYSDDAQRVTSMLIDGNTNPSTLYVAIGYPYTSSTRRPGVGGGANGVYKATVPGGGAPSFTLITTPSNGWPANTGTGTTGDVGRIELDWNAAHTRIYAHVSDYGTTSGNIGYTLGIWTTGDGGATWTQLSGTANSNFRNCRNTIETGGQDWYDLFIAVDQTNDKTLYSGRIDLYKVVVNSTYTGASSITALGNVYGTTCSGYGTLHPDQHAFAWIPGSTQFLVGSDGGMHLGTGAVGGFTSLNSTINTMQFYAGQIGRDFANTSGSQVQYLFGGFQDNGNASWTSANANLQWQARSVGGDGFYTAFDPLAGTTSAGRWYTEYTYGALSCSTTGAGGSFTSCAPSYSTGSSTGIDKRDWNTPFMVDQWNCTNAQCNNLILGSSRVWASVNTARPTWTATGSTDLTKNINALSTIVALNVAHKNPGTVIVGTSDGNAWWSNNVFTGSNCTAAAANTSSFACTVNSSATWVNLTGSNAVLPNRSISGVAFDPNTNLTFYAAVGGFNTNTPATPGHLFRGACSASPCTTANITWTRKDIGLPDMPFNAVAVNPNLPNQVFVGTDLGLFYTNDVTAADPVWYRFQNGLPWTTVVYLSPDRGASATPYASTTLAAWTFGRGVFTARLGGAYTPTAITAGAASVAAGDAALPLLLIVPAMGLALLAAARRRAR